MARIRTIKPEFFTSLTIADLTPEQRLTFIGLWTHVDDEGRCVDDARLIKAAVWPLDDRTAADVEGDLNAIHIKDLIVRYVAKGKRCLSVAGWGEHQRINRPSPSKLPSPDEGTPTPPGDSLRAHGGLTEPSNAARTAPREGSQNPHSGPSGASDADSASQQGGALPSGQLTSTNSDSVSPHAQLTEDSPPERNREQGTGKGTPPPSADPPKGATTRGTRLPDDFQVTPDMAAWAAANAPTCGTRDHEAFCDHWRSTPGAKGRKLDWIATWRNWMRREHERRARPANARPASRPAPDERAATIQALKHNPPGPAPGRPLNLIQGELA